MGLMDQVGQRVYVAPMQNTGSGFQVQEQTSAGVSSPSMGLTIELLMVLGGLVLVYVVTRRIQGA